MLLALLIQALSPVQPITAEQFAQGLASNAAYRRGRFVERGLPPIEEVAAAGRDVRRLLAQLWLPGRPPAMEIERRSDGSVTLTLAWKDRPLQRHKLAPGVWRELTALDEEVFRRPTAPPTPEEIARRGLSCHGDQGHFESAQAGKASGVSADQCAGSLEAFTDARRRAAEIFVREAVASQPGCRAEAAESGLDRLMSCFK